MIQKRYIIAHQKGKRVVVDTLWIPFMMQKLIDKTKIKNAWTTKEEVMDVCLEREEDWKKIRMRLGSLNKYNLLNSRLMTLTEKRKFCGLRVGRKPKVYIIGKEGKRILEGYGNFTDYNCPLMHPRRRNR